MKNVHKDMAQAIATEIANGSGGDGSVYSSKYDNFKILKLRNGYYTRF